MAKAKVNRTRKVSIEVVGNGYSVTTECGSSEGGVIRFYFSGDTQVSSPQLSGTYVFNDFSQLSAFLRKHLSAPTGP